MDLKKKKKPGFMVALALKPKGDDKDPEGFDDDEDMDERDEDSGPDPDEALSDAGKAFREALDAKDDLALANAIAEIVELHGEMKDSES